jgi:carbon monoxide dehydrogenase subunit G
MFTVKAAFNDQFEFAANLEKIRDFFADIANFAELMPGVKRAYTDAKGIAQLTIEADIPVVGTMTQNFSVELTDNANDRIEWTPARTETQNFLRYSADFLENPGGSTLVQFSQAVELRRERPRDLHFLASLAGESLISSEMNKRFAEMVSTFIERARERVSV